MNDKANIIETFTELAPRYEEVVDSELNRFWGWSYSAFINQLLETTPIPTRGKILDLATGTGVIPRKIVREGMGMSRVHGLDITLSMLARARNKLTTDRRSDQVDLVCASAMEIPYASGSFDLVTCALATHHMDVRLLLSESWRILRPRGTLSIADVGGSSLWKQPIVKAILRVAAFLYFLIHENSSRAWAEAEAVSNVRSQEEWTEILAATGFQKIKVKKLISKHSWIPEPLLIQAIKPISGGSE